MRNGFACSFEADPHDVDPDTIKEIGIARVMLGGRTLVEA